jgi:hypothetical protein
MPTPNASQPNDRQMVDIHFDSLNLAKQFHCFAILGPLTYVNPGVFSHRIYANAASSLTHPLEQ